MTVVGGADVPASSLSTVDASEADRLVAAEVLRADEARLRLVIDASQLRTWEWDFASDRFTWSSQQDDATTSDADTDTFNRRRAEGIVAEDVAGVHDAMRNAFHHGVDFDHEFRIHTLTGVRWVSARATVDRDESGNPTRMVGIAADVTDRHAVEGELRSSQAFLSSVLENVPTMVFVKAAADLSYVSINRAGEELVGATRDEIVGRTAYELFPEQADDSTAHDREVLDGKIVVDIPVEILSTVDKGERMVHTRKIPILDGAGLTEYLVGISEDVTEREKTQQELEAARDEANRANTAKSEFLSRMSHELRTPLNSVLGFAQLLTMDELNQEQSEYVRFITQAGRHLLELIDEVLDIARIESGKLQLSLEPVGVWDVVHDAVDLIRPKANQLKVTVAVQSHDAEIYAVADRQRLMQVLLNLLSNAVKYNRPGGRVIVEVVNTGETVLLTVEDTGIGITARNLTRLFTPFERLGAESTAVEGSGVGLALSRVLAQQMRGALTVESRIGVGSTFTVELPEAATSPEMSDAEAHRPVIAEPTSAATVRVLYIDDNVANVTLIERAFRRRIGIELITAVQGTIGLELAAQHHPDVIMLDLHLPDMSGEQVLSRLLADPSTRSIPVIVCSADASPSQVRHVLELGAVRYLTKPLDLFELFELIERVRGGLLTGAGRDEMDGE
jgi:PAS domain S-box-containing protein